MAVEKVGEHYKCNVCGNEVNVTKVRRRIGMLWPAYGKDKLKIRHL